MKIKMFPFAAIGTLLLIGSGCANHIQDINTVTQENERKILNTKYELKLTPETMKDSSYHIVISKMESAEVKKYEVKTHKIVETPYQWWREFYEIPASFALIPASIGTHVLFVATVGILPYRIPDSVTALAFTGINPALNWESDTRKLERLVSINRKMLSNETENMTTALAKENIVITSGSKTAKYQTDEFGGFDLDFLSINEKKHLFSGGKKTFLCSRIRKGTQTCYPYPRLPGKTDVGKNPDQFL